jgi:hypothetical protein
VSDDLGAFHFDINGIFSEQAAGAVRRGRFGQTLSISHLLGPFTVVGELWHFTQPLTSEHAVGNLWALSYPVRKYRWWTRDTITASRLPQPNGRGS